MLNLAKNPQPRLITSLTPFTIFSFAADASYVGEIFNGPAGRQALHLNFGLGRP